MEVFKMSAEVIGDSYVPGPTGPAMVTSSKEPNSTATSSTAITSSEEIKITLNLHK